MSADLPGPSAQSFYPDNSKYRCLCGRVHVKYGTMIVGIMEAVTVLSCGIGVLIEQPKLWIFVLVLLLISIGPLICLFVSLRTEKACLLNFARAYQIMIIIWFIVGIIFIGFMLAGNEAVTEAVLSQTSPRDKPASDSSEYSTKRQLSGEQKAFCVVLVVFFAILLVFAVWSYVIVSKCYDYFKDKQKYGDYTAGTVAYAGGDSIPMMEATNNAHATNKT